MGATGLGPSSCGTGLTSDHSGRALKGIRSTSSSEDGIEDERTSEPNRSIPHLGFRRARRGGRKATSELGFRLLGFYRGANTARKACLASRILKQHGSIPDHTVRPDEVVGRLVTKSKWKYAFITIIYFSVA